MVFTITNRKTLNRLTVLFSKLREELQLFLIKESELVVLSKNIEAFPQSRRLQQFTPVGREMFDICNLL